MSLSPLSVGSIEQMLSGNEPDPERPILRVLGLWWFKEPSNGIHRWCLTIFDGTQIHKFVMLYSTLNHLVTSGKLSRNAIIKVKHHIPLNNMDFPVEKRFLYIKELDILHSGQDVVGDHESGQPVAADASMMMVSIPTTVKMELIADDSNAVQGPQTSTPTVSRPPSVESPDTTLQPSSPPRVIAAKNSRTEEVEIVAPALNQTSTPSSAAVQTSRLVAICSKDYPLIHLTPEQIDELTVAILDKIVQNKDGQVKPKFTNSLLKTGYLSLTCKDDLTTDWLAKIIPTIVPWEGAKLHAVDEEALPYPRCAITFIPNGAKLDTNRILALLEAQNDHYKFGAWALLNRTSIGINTTVIFAIDKISADLLKQNNYELNFGFGAISVGF